MEVKKLNLARIISAILICGIMIFCTGLNVHAEESKDGISVTVSSDKENYSSADEVNLKITVKNTNNFEVINLKIENILPDGISLVSGDISKDNINLQANEETTMNLTVKKSDSGQANTTENVTSNAIATEKNTTVSKSAILPNTGDNKSVLIALIVMLVSILVMIICFLLKDRKKYSKFLSVLICLGVINVLGITGITYASLDKTQAETTNSSEENKSSFTTEFTYIIDDVSYTHNVTTTYYDVDLYIFEIVGKALQETIITDTFKNASLEERKEIAFNLLNKLESENKIKKGSIKFNEKYNSYFFEYINGGEGSVILENFSSSEENEIDDWKTYNISDTITSNYIPSNITENINNKEDLNYALNDSANGYIKENLSKNNLTYYPKKALIIDDVSIESDEERNAFDNHKKIWSSNDLKTDIKSNVTVEEFKTILIGYDFIDINAHGYIDKNGNPTVFLQEKQEENFFKNLFNKRYKQDIKEGRVGTTYGFWGGNFYLTSSFFSHYYSNKLTDTIVWLSCCKGYINDTLVSTFANECSAKAVIGATDSVYAYYDTDMTDIFVHKLLFGLTVDEALKEAKSFYGKNSNEYRLNPEFGDGKSGKYYAEFKNYNGGNETLVKLVRINNNGTLSGIVTDENNNPIENAEIGIHNVRGMSYGITATTNENGEYTLECPQDSYKIGVKADGYETFETDDFINIHYGEETIFNITLKKEIITTEPTANYEWHLAPTIEAEDINVVDEYQWGVNYGHFIESEYNVIKINGKYGVIDTNGNIVVNPEYDSIYGDLDNHICLKNNRNNILLCCKNNTTTNDNYYCNICGAELSTTVYGSDYVYDLSLNRLALLATMPHINNSMNELIFGGQNSPGLTYSYKPVVARNSVFSDVKDYTHATFGNKFGIVKNNKILLDFEYSNATSYKESITALCKDDKWGYVNDNGDIIIPFEYDGDFIYSNSEKLAYLPSDNYIALNKNGGGGYSDIQGNEVISCGTFEEARPVHNGLAWVKKNGKWGVIKLKDIEIETNIENNENWRHLYADELRRYINDDDYSNEATFDLYYYNDNNIPELYISLHESIVREYKLDEATINSVLLNIETPKEPLFTGMVNTEKDPLNVRKSPSTEAEIIGRLDKGSTVTVYSEADGWCEIEYNGGIGYISKEYIKINGDTENQQKLNIADVIINQYKTVAKENNLIGLIDIDLDGELEFAVFSFGKRNSNDVNNSNYFDFYNINTENNTLDLIELSEDTGANATQLKLYQDNSGNKFYIGYNFTANLGELMLKIQYVDGKINVETLARNEMGLKYFIQEAGKWREATQEEYNTYTSQFSEIETDLITETFETFNNMSDNEKEKFLLRN